MPPWLVDIVYLLVALLLVGINGFFVAAEFALVKVRGSQVDDLVRQRRPFAKTAKWLAERLEPSLSSCQLGITMASLALGWVGEPAFAHLIEPVFTWMGMRSEVLLHTLAFIIAFTAITALHLVIGEQAPKIFAIRKPDVMLLWCAVPMKAFFVVSYPLMAMLNWTTSWLLGKLGLESDGEHGDPVSEQELRLMIRESHRHGHLTRAEHSLINAVFEFDDLVCRRVMVPRNEIDFFDVNASFAECIQLAQRTKHTRFPVCDGSLDEVMGVVHVKDLVGIAADAEFEVRSIMRPPRKVPENMPISKLLLHFQATHQLLAFVIDEYGTVIGIVTLENVLEEIIGDIDDEFDVQQKEFVPDGPDAWFVLGSAPVEDIRRVLKIDVAGADVDTFSGLLTQYAERILIAGDQLTIDGYLAEVLEVRDDRAVRVRVSRLTSDDTAAAAPAEPDGDPEPGTTSAEGSVVHRDD